jgi:hypothetical protein
MPPPPPPPLLTTTVTDTPDTPQPSDAGAIAITKEDRRCEQKLPGGHAVVYYPHYAWEVYGRVDEDFVARDWDGHPIPGCACAPPGKDIAVPFFMPYFKAQAAQLAAMERVRLAEDMQQAALRRQEERLMGQQVLRI